MNIHLLLMVLLVKYGWTKRGGAGKSNSRKGLRSSHVEGGGDRGPMDGGWTNNNDTQTRLIVKLLRNYNPKLRPVWDYHKSVVVYLNLRPYQLLDVDEVNQCITTSMWMTETWDDTFLFWDFEEFENISQIHLPHTDVWRPDTYLYNNLEMDPQTVQRLMNVIITTNKTSKAAKVKLQYPAIFRTSCIMNVANFPFDQQQCAMTFGSWTHDNTDIDFEPEQNNVSLDYFIPNQEWDIISFYAERIVNKYDCCPNPYTIVVYHIALQRKPLFYTVNLIIPSVIVAFINYIGFFTPTSSSGERGEKVTLGLTTLLALAVILLQLTDHTPHSSTAVSLLGWFILSLIVLVGTGTVMTVIIIHLQHKGECGHPSTPALRRLLLCIGWIAGLPCRRKKQKWKNGLCTGLGTWPKYQSTANSSCLAGVPGAPIAIIDDAEAIDTTPRAEQGLLPGHEANSTAQPVHSFMNTDASSTRTSPLLASRETNASNDTITAETRREDSPARVSKKDHLQHQEQQTIQLQHAVWSLTKQSIRELRRIVAKTVGKDTDQSESIGDTEKSEWILAAVALERLCLFIFCSATIGITLLILLIGESRVAKYPL